MAYTLMDFLFASQVGLGGVGVGVWGLGVARRGRMPSPHKMRPLTPLAPPNARPPKDASTASLIWSLTQMTEHPDVLERVRQARARGRPGGAAGQSRRRRGAAGLGFD
jgi:hypothetical protein